MTLLRRVGAVSIGGLLGAALLLVADMAEASERRDRGRTEGFRIDTRNLDEGFGEFEDDYSEADEASDRPRRRVRRKRRARRRFRHNKRDFRASVYVGGDRFGIFLNQRDFRRFRGRPRRDYYFRGGFAGHRYNRRFARAGHWYVAPRHRGLFRRACHPVFKRGFYDGYRVLIRGRRCYDRRGRGFIVRGSRRIVEYY